MAGRKPKPTKLKLLEGNPGRRPINKREPQLAAKIPEMPKWLKSFPVAVEEWERESQVLFGMGILTEADTGLFAQRCYLASEIQQLAIEIQKEGRVSYSIKMDSLGNEVADAKANPKAIQLKNLITEYRQTGTAFGLDPASRTKISTPGEPDNELEKIIGNIRKG